MHRAWELTPKQKAAYVTASLTENVTQVKHMETLIKLLSDRKIAPPKNLTDIVKGYGYNPEQLSAEEAQMVADELGKGQMVKPAPTNGKGQRSQAGTSVEQLQRSLLEASAKQEANLDAFTRQLKTRRAAKIDGFVEENFALVNSTSNDAANALARRLAEVESSPDTFLELANRFADNIQTAS